jgi:hypothetical protein
VTIPARNSLFTRFFLGSLIAVCLCVTFAFPGGASAEEITYRGFMVADGKIGDWQFHNARVYLTFQGDTANIQTMLFPFSTSNPVDGAAQVDINSGGTATVTIITPQKTVYAIFQPGQIFVSMDHGDIFSATPLPLAAFNGARGVGFGTFNASSPGGIEPAYPMAIEDGTIDWGDYSGYLPANFINPELSELPANLFSNTAFSGRVWSCVGFPGSTCPSPSFALSTNQGDLYFYQSYLSVTFDDAMSGGTFVACRNATGCLSDSGLTTYWGHNNDTSKPITYRAALLANVTLGATTYHRAEVYLSFNSDVATAVPFHDMTSAGYMNSVGQASARIVSGNQIVEANFYAGQLYVYYDQTHGTGGFGSVGGGRGYPFALTSFQDSNGLVEDNLIGAVTDILGNPAHAVNYSAPTANVVTNLTQTFQLAGGASSCVSLDPVSSICSNVSPVALKTDKGNFLITEPYTIDATALNGTQPFSVNWGIFWAEIP